MLTNDAIRTSPDIRLYSDELISVKSLDDNETYWFSKRGLPWGTRENSSFLSHRNYAPSGSQSTYKGNAPGSLPGYSFHWVGASDRLYLFEAPVDLLSYISMHKSGWRNHSYA